MMGFGTLDMFQRLASYVKMTYGVEVTALETPIPFSLKIIVKGDEKNRKEAIQFIEGFRHIGCIFEYVERSWLDINQTKEEI